MIPPPLHIHHLTISVPLPPHRPRLDFQDHHAAADDASAMLMSAFITYAATSLLRRALLAARTDATPRTPPWR